MDKSKVRVLTATDVTPAKDSDILGKVGMPFFKLT